MSQTIRNACVTNRLPIAQGLSTKQINRNPNDYNAYANRSFIFARKYLWDNALHDALQVRVTQLRRIIVG